MSLGPWEIALIVLVVVLLFGARKLPELARSMGRSMRIFKSEVKEMKSEDGESSQQGQIAASKQDSEEFWNSPDTQPGQTQPTKSQENTQQQQ